MNLFYSTTKKNLIDLENNCCSFDEWMKDKGANDCCKHENGFYIFLNPEEIESSDEYKNNDPYVVMDQLESDFQQRRLKSTIDLIPAAAKNQSLRLLDIGCGEGHFTDVIKKEFPKFEVHGLDYSVSAIDYAHKTFSEINFITANAYHPPYQNEYFDIVVCNNLWEHVPDPLQMLRAMKRVLKPNGLLIVSTPSRYRFSNLIKALGGQKIEFMSTYHVTEYTIGQVKEQLKWEGFTTEKVYSPPIPASNFIFTIIKSIMRMVLKLLNSHHVLESTVFYAAKKSK
ncbi:MAG: class I SAM-dependent methyltransferase [Vicingaceae bacterium]